MKLERFDEGAGSASSRGEPKFMFGRTPGQSSSRIGLAVIALAMFAGLSALYPNFATATNVATIGLNMTPVLIASIGTAALLTAGQIDLSIGSMYAFVAVIIALVAHAGLPIPIIIATGLGVGLLCGLLNGALVRLLKISPLIVTIGMLAIYRGVAYVFADGVSVFGFPPSFLALGRGKLLGIDYPVLFALIIFVIGGVVLTRTRLGLHIYATGGDARAAQLNGVPTGRLIVGLFAANGLLIGAVATLAAARIGSISPTIAVQFEFDVVTAAILGGVSFAGGAGRPLGVFVGVTTIGILNAGVLFVGLDNSYQQIAKGCLLLVALAADEISSFLRSRRAARKSIPAAIPADGAEPVDFHPTGSRRVPFASGPVVLSVKGITQRYGAIEALKEVDFAIQAGEVVCLLGDNGAGKSSLIRIMSGAEQPTEGVISAHGAPVRFSSVAAARQFGVDTVYQDLALCPNLDVIHNLVLGAEPVRRVFGASFRDEAAAAQLAQGRLKRLGSLVRDHRALVRNLSGGQRQAIAIARAAGADSKLVILDEPTAALGVIQKHQVLDVIRNLADHGAAVILITHDVSMVEAVADRAVVLRLGRVVYDGKTAGLTQLDLLHLMAGDAVAAPRTGLAAGISPA